MSKRKTRHIRAFIHRDENRAVVINTTTKKFLWLKGGDLKSMIEAVGYQNKGAKSFNIKDYCLVKDYTKVVL